MAVLKKSAMKELSVEGLKAKITEFEHEVEAERIAKTTAGKPANPGRARSLRKTIARIKTLLTRKGFKELAAPAAVAKPTGLGKARKQPKAKTPFSARNSIK